MLVTPSASAPVAASVLAPAPAPAPISTGLELPKPPSANRSGSGVGGSADQDRLYRVGHDAQFARHDYGAAVAAWDHYLEAAGPGGRFTLEARYNRGVALVKTGRAAEARAALQPFADGEYGGYRHDEARSLLRSLD